MDTSKPEYKAIVVGGTSGVGLAVVQALIEQNYSVYAVGRHRPKEISPDDKRCTFVQSDLRDYDEALFDAFSKDPLVKVLFLTAGFGRVANFEYLHPAEIVSLMEVNTVSALRIIRQFYERIKSPERFYCGIVSSIAGLVSSPMFSAYAASKAAICRFTESINIELEASGTENRILNVAPGSISGTRFSSGENDMAQIRPIGDQIVSRLFAGETLYIPDYEKTYKDVLTRYQADGHTYGMESYQYKEHSGRAVNKQCATIGYLSGTFDLFHIGHLNLLRRAKAQCDYLIVGVHNSGDWKGKESFIPFEERMEIIKACKYVDRVVPSCTEDSDAWSLYHYHKLFVGSDYKGSERFDRYEAFFKDKGVEVVYFPYTQSTSSTQLRAVIQRRESE